LRCRRCFVSAGFSCGYVKFKPFRFDKKRQLKNDETTLLNSYLFLSYRYGFRENGINKRCEGQIDDRCNDLSEINEWCV
ncbi:MAG: hypothetical protein AB1414_21015, partial [bacterium]